MVRRIFILVLLAFTVMLSACSQKNENQEIKEVAVDGGGSYYDVSIAEFTRILKEKDFTLVNVHIPYEGNIPGTDVSIPYDKIDQHLDQLPAERDAKIVLYCRSDSMSKTAAKTLVKLGYTNVWNVRGGFTAWKEAGNPFEE